eukprot:TRINITY_DN48594_c0_g1_i1.p1 TRINITY_DN48594_c0_g1~~TRINITY_DN48594_c0_g1_i1.p1  ORF type:complete len:418 (-),score=96.66 TRINITY_DN48594_c0_g1_i1:215-1468(-)
MAPADIHSDDYYKVLGVATSASDDEIKKAYMKLALKHHPDKNPNTEANPKRKEQAEANFKKISEAYDTLRNPEKRRIYDQVGNDGLNGGAPGGAAPRAGGFSGYGGQGQGMSREQADEIFRMFFGGAGGGQGQGQGQSFVFGGMPGSGMFGAGSDGSASEEEHHGNYGFNMNGMGMGMGMPGMGMSMPGMHGMSGMGGMGGMGPQFMQMGGMGPSGGLFSGQGQRLGRGGSGRTGGASGSGARHRERSGRARNLPSYAVPLGTPVIVGGLSKATTHNGRVGQVSSWDDAQGRYEISFQSPEGQLGVKPQNLTQLCQVEVSGLEGKQELNGLMGQIAKFDRDKGRYIVMVNGNDGVLSLKPGNCLLLPGTRVLIDGLENRDFNGQMAQIQAVDKAAKRYTVSCRNGKVIKVKYDNVRC